MALVAPGFTVPTRKTLTDRIERMFHAEMASNKADVASQPAGNVHITHDSWTSADNISYYVVTAHWLDEELHLQERVLTVRPVSGGKADDIQLDIEATVRDFQLTDPVATVDNCGAEINGITQAGLDLVSCQGHNNHRAVIAGMGNTTISKAVSTQRSIVTYFNKSSTAKQLFLDAQEDELRTLPDRTPLDQPKSLIQDVSKSWNTTHAMIHRNLELSSSLRMAVESPFVECNNPDLADKIATGSEKKLLKEVSMPECLI